LSPVTAAFCLYPGLVKNGGFTVEPANTTIYTVDTVIKYFCNSGYKLGGDDERTCLENGTWSGEQPSCKSTIYFF